MTRVRSPRSGPERGASLLELLIALVMLSLGILAVGQLFPAGSRGQLQDRMATTANNYAQDKVEELSTNDWTDAELSAGRHPPGTATEALGPAGQWQRFYQVDVMAAPLDNLKRVTVTVSWTFMSPRSVSATTYLRR